MFTAILIEESALLESPKRVCTISISVLYRVPSTSTNPKSLLWVKATLLVLYLEEEEREEAKLKRSVGVGPGYMFTANLIGESALSKSAKRHIQLM